MGGLALPIASSIVLPVPPAQPSYVCGESKEDPERSRLPVDRVGRRLSTLDRFHAIAARLPPPPSLLPGNGPGALDTTDLGVCHRDVAQSRNKPAGVVQLPPLNCARRSECPGGKCGCGSKCGGSCRDHPFCSGMLNEQQHRTRNQPISGTGTTIRPPSSTRGSSKRPLAISSVSRSLT